MRLIPGLALLGACNDEGLLDAEGRDLDALADCHDDGVVGPAAFFAGDGVFAVDFVSTAASGADLNDAGEVTGTSYQDTGCGSTCLPPQDTVVWSGADRLVLPSLAGLSGIYVRGIGPDGQVVGLAGLPGTTTHAVLWEPDGAGSYAAIDLGTLPGTTISEAIGIDDLGRVIGWSTTSNFPPTGAPFLWTEADGMVDLTTLGFPNEFPYAISPGGTVATATSFYSLDDPASLELLTPAPAGFWVGGYATAINDDGEQARFLVDNGPENLVYLYRYHTDGTWNQIHPFGTGHLTTYGMGSIDAQGTITATVGGGGVIAFGPDGEAEDLIDFVSPAYGTSGVTVGGPHTEDGVVLANLFVGASSRVVKLTPAEPCTSNCLMVRNLKMKAFFVDKPGNPGQCVPGAYSEVKVRVTVNDETGAALEGVDVFGRFLDDYWTNMEITGTTDALGQVGFIVQLPPCVGTTAFFVDDLVLDDRSFDRTRGTLAASKIPQ